MARFGKDYTRPGETGPRSADVERVRAEMIADADSKHAGEVKKATQALREQLAMEQGILDVQEKGADAMARVRQAYVAIALFQAGASAEQIRANNQLFETGRATLLKTELLDLNRKLAATEAITAAELSGAEAVRQATLQAKYDEMLAKAVYGAQTPVIVEAIKKQDEAEHQAQILHDALATGMAYRDRLYSLDQEIGKLKEILAVDKDNLEANLSKKKLEDERLDTLAQQTLAMGRLQDGVRAFFLEMQREGETTAQIIYKSLESSLDQFSDTVAKAITGQKAAWGKMFKEIGDEMVRSTIRQQLGHVIGILGKHFPHMPGLPGIPGIPGHPTHPRIDASRLPGKSAAEILRSWKQDGQTPQSAFWVQIANTGFPEQGAGPAPFGFPIPGVPSAIGEAGPAISFGAPPGTASPWGASPSLRSAVMPSRNSGNSGGYHYTIIQDNRGTDPVLTEQRTQQGILAAHNAAVSNAMAVQVEFQKRSPT